MGADSTSGGRWGLINVVAGGGMTSGMPPPTKVAGRKRVAGAAV